MEEYLKALEGISLPDWVALKYEMDKKFWKEFTNQDEPEFTESEIKAMREELIQSLDAVCDELRRKNRKELEVDDTETVN